MCEALGHLTEVPTLSQSWCSCIGEWDQGLGGSKSNTSSLACSIQSQVFWPWGSYGWYVDPLVVDLRLKLSWDCLLHRQVGEASEKLVLAL